MIASAEAPAFLYLSTALRTLLLRLRGRQTASQRLVRRVHIILAVADNPSVGAVARQLHLTRLTVRHWRDRWRDAAVALQQAEQEQATEAQLLALLQQLLDDAPRSGTPPTFTPEQIVQIVAVACEPPERSGRPLSHWTARELADEVQKRQIVRAISPRSVGRFLKRGRLAAAAEPLLAQRQPRGSRGFSSASGHRL